MIYDKLENLKNYKGAIPHVEEFLDFASKFDLNDLPIGKTILSDNVYINKSQYTAKAFEDAKGETHKNYIDIQLIIGGAERMDFDNICDVGSNRTEYNPEKDVTHYFENLSNSVIVKQGFFAVFFPEDVHKPCIKVNENEVKKVLVKLKVN